MFFFFFFFFIPHFFYLSIYYYFLTQVDKLGGTEPLSSETEGCLYLTIHNYVPATSVVNILASLKSGL